MPIQRSAIHTARRLLSTSAVAALGGVALTGCGALGPSEYCSTLTDADGLGATVYTPYVGTEPPADWAQARLDLLDEAGEPDAEDLADDQETYRDYLEDLTELGPDQMSDAIGLTADEPEIKDAREALFDDYNSTCDG